MSLDAAPARALLAGALDYAGLFPPAELAMAEAVENYYRYLASREAWALGRFVIPATRLEEFEPLGDAAFARLAAVGGPDAEEDARAIAAFNQRCAGRAQVDTIEAATPTPEIVAERVAASPGQIVYCEINPALPGFHATAHAVSAAGARAKMRTGGVRAEAIPPVPRLLAFLQLCLELELPCKLTAGLHHALRGSYPLTYADQAPQATMHGFLNVMLAHAYLHAGGPPVSARHILERESAAGLRSDDQGIVWQGTRWSTPQIEASRSMLVGFGTCSFEEPLACLASL